MHVADPEVPAAPASVTSLPPITRADVCIAGAGLPALLAAYLLVRAHRSVVVLEESTLGAVQAGIGTSRMSSLPDVSWRHARDRGGLAHAREAARSHAAAVESLEGIVRRERIACELERLDAYVRVDGGSQDARAEHAAALQAGIEDAEILDRLAVPGGDWGAVVRYPAQVRLQPLKLAQGLARAISRAGGRILLGVTAARVPGTGEAALITAGGQRIEAGVVVAPHAPRAEGRLEAPATQRIAHVVGVRVPRGSMSQAIYRDAHGFPIDASLLSHGRGAGEVLLVGGEDPPGDDDHTAFRYLALEQWARERFPGAGPVVHRGTVQALPEHDLVAWGGVAGPRGVQARARGGSALTRAMLDALAIVDFVEGNDSAWPELFVQPADDAPRAGARA